VAVGGVDVTVPELGADAEPKFNTTPAEWFAWRRLNTVFTDLACTQPGDLTLSGDGEPEQVPTRKVTFNFWSVLGVQPMLGAPSRKTKTIRACAWL